MIVLLVDEASRGLSSVAGARSMQTLVSTLSDQSQQLSPDLVTTRPRRASMYDALDFTKIDASLYQRPVR